MHTRVVVFGSVIDKSLSMLSNMVIKKSHVERTPHCRRIVHVPKGTVWFLEGLGV